MSFCLNLEVDVFVSMFARVVLGEGVWGGFMGNIKGRGVVIVSVIMGHSFIFFLLLLLFFFFFFFFLSVCCVWLCVHLSFILCICATTCLLSFI